MRKSFCVLVLLLSVVAAHARDPFAHTFSIVARDAATGELGVAVQSHWFQVGPLVPWAEAGVGAVATQSFVKVDYGPLGLQLMKQGMSAQQALDKLLAEDSERDVRQVAMVDAKGRVAAWTGPKCIAAAGDETGDGFSVQANMMATPEVWPAMAAAFRQAHGDLADRMLAALEAAQSVGGDLRGRQSAALIVVRATSDGKPWNDRLVDLRVDDSLRPLVELRRLLGLHRAYAEMNAGDAALALGNTQEALDHYSAAARMEPDIPELPFWEAVTMASTGRVEEALPIFHRVFALAPRWSILVQRLPAVGQLPDDPELMRRILAQAPAGSPR
jgi:uncharacterized Ntn-hydrolase superfamily protein